ncbi:MAG: ABC transporter substrate-binding protein [Oscillospiraceae bacterium]|nr:ABC transporter substrate-binding protein [Oscillospiraceae bacterium]
MKRVISLCLLLALLLCGCSAPAEENGAEGYTFTDDLDRTVTVTSTERVAALLGSYADIWLLAGGTVCAAADDAWDDFDLPLSEDTVNLGGTKDLSLEALLASAPTFVLASTNTPQHLEWESALQGAGITVAYFDVSSFDDYLRMLKTCTELTGNEESYARYGESVAAVVEEVTSRSRAAMEEDAATVLVLRASASSIRAKNSEGNVLGELLCDMGCINIADSDSNLLENLSVESIYLQDPDHIFIVQVGDDAAGMKENVNRFFAENPLWLELDAVKNDRVHYMDKRLFNLKPNAYWGESYIQLEEILFG